MSVSVIDRTRFYLLQHIAYLGALLISFEFSASKQFYQPLNGQRHIGGQQRGFDNSLDLVNLEEMGHLLLSSRTHINGRKRLVLHKFQE